MAVPHYPADLEEGSSPKVIALDAAEGTPDDELPQAALDKETKAKQDEDTDDVSKNREGDIYAEAVLACSIENPESCVMCSG